MNGYLGETLVKRPDLLPEFAGWTTKDWALKYIEMYGGIDGEHHKAWVLDQVARILNGAIIEVSQAKWDNGHSEFRYRVLENDDYHMWVAKVRSGEDGPETYSYEVGIAP